MTDQRERQTPGVPANEGGTRPSSTRSFFSRLRVRLLLLVLMAILPALALVLYTAFDQRRGAMQDGAASAQRVVSFAATAHRQHIESARQLLATLSQLKEIDPQHPRETEALLRKLLRTHTLYANLGAINDQGQLFANANPRATGPDDPNRPSHGERPFFQAARDSNKFTRGAYRLDDIPNKATFTIAYPMRDAQSGRFSGVIFAALNLDWVSQHAARSELPDGSTVTLVDRPGTVLVRYALTDAGREWIGRSITNRPGMEAFIQGGQEIVNVAKGLDGIKRLFVSGPFSRTGGIVDARLIVGIPLHVAYAAADQTLAQNLIFLSIASMLALGAAWSGGDIFILRQVRNLVGAAKQMALGVLSARSQVDYKAGEIGQLAQSFDEMAATLESRVAELQQAEAELTALNEELEHRVVERTLELKRSNEDLEQFAYVASHDLQEPLRMIRNYIQLLQQRYGEKLDTNALEFIGFALDGAKRMQQLIHDLLTYSRVGTRGKELVPVNCEEILEDVLSNLNVAIDEASADVRHDPLPTILGDPVQLIQLFQNLIGNAVKFRGEGPPVIRIEANRKGPDWEFSVADNGIGIAEQDFERIFVVFQRLHSRDKYQGTGIGLSVCKKIVERHGGRMWVESRLGQGTTFHFSIPAMSEEQ